MRRYVVECDLCGAVVQNTLEILFDCGISDQNIDVVSRINKNEFCSVKCALLHLGNKLKIYEGKVG